jgi:hypothetical protein
MADAANMLELGLENNSLGGLKTPTLLYGVRLKQSKLSPNFIQVFNQSYAYRPVSASNPPPDVIQTSYIQLKF